jgi:hypothetical protein
VIESYLQQQSERDNFQDACIPTLCELQCEHNGRRMVNCVSPESADILMICVFFLGLSKVGSKLLRYAVTTRCVPGPSLLVRDKQ